MTRKFSVPLVLLVGIAMLIACVAPAAAQPIPAPHIDNVLPARGPVGAFVVIAGSDFGVPTAFSRVTFNGVAAENIVTWQNGLITVQVPEGATTGPVVVRSLGGESNGVTFTVTSLQPAQSWYLAEGSTAWGFETFILMENTTDVDATVNVIYNTAQFGRLPRPQALNVPPSSRVTLRVNDDINNVDVSTQLNSSQPIVCERAMYWNNRIEGTGSVGVTSPDTTWYLAEGCTTYPFETWLCIQNPSLITTANVDVTYMTPTGAKAMPTTTVGPGVRKTIDVSKDIGATDVSAKIESDQPVVCERAMYWDGRRGGHNSLGVAGPSSSWYLAEGSTAWGFDTWLLLQNPANATAKVEVTYMTSDGPVVEPTLSVPANSRMTVHVNEKVVNMDTSIQVTSDKGVIAERAMYWDNGTGRAGTDTVGFSEPANEIYLAEGSTAWGFDTYVCIQNPNDKAVDVEVTYMTNEGSLKGATRKIPAKSRVTVRMADEVPNRDASVKLVCERPIMAERATYWNGKGGGTASIGWVPGSDAL